MPQMRHAGIVGLSGIGYIATRIGLNMNLRWKVSHIGPVRITHWEKHDPKKILDALTKTRSEGEIDGSNPKVFVSRLYGNKIAVRFIDHLSIEPARIVDPFPDLFGRLQQMVRKKAAVIELPYAFVENVAPGVDAILGKWKGFEGKSRRLDQVIGDDSVPLVLRLSLIKLAAKKLAKLHAKGFTHSHPGAHNFVVESLDPHPRVSIIDFSGLQELDPVLGYFNRRKDFSTFLKSYILSNDERRIIEAAYNRHYSSVKRRDQSPIERKVGDFLRHIFTSHNVR